jgi:bleomycin hydrolase
MKRIMLFSFLSLLSVLSMAQRVDDVTAERSKIGKAGGAGMAASSKGFIVEKNNAATTVKNQQSTGTCWAFSTTALLESQLLKSNTGNFDLSEMYTVRNIYLEKAKNYILRQGNTQFGEGGLGHDVIRSISKYGAMPESIYSGHRPGENIYNHSKMVSDLKIYLDSILASRVKLRRQIYIAENWIDGFVKILDANMGVPPSDFIYNSKRYTALSFAKEVMKFNADDYVNITSFTHQPYFTPYVLEVPDNFSNGLYYNVPLKDMMDLTKTALKTGYTVLWDADVSNPGFQQKLGIAISTDSMRLIAEDVNPDLSESRWDEKIRQHLYEILTTQDDHLMQITGLAKSKGGKQFFVVKNSWGDIGPYNGFIEVSESYFAINTISLVVPKAALSKFLLDKLKLN